MYAGFVSVYTHIGVTRLGAVFYAIFTADAGCSAWVAMSSWIGRVKLLRAPILKIEAWNSKHSDLWFEFRSQHSSRQN